MARAFRKADRAARKEQDRKVVEQTGLRTQRRSSVYTPLWLPPPGAAASDDAPTLNRERNCYVCKQSFTTLHRYFDSMCRTCGDFNYAKREQTADLSGHYALVIDPIFVGRLTGTHVWGQFLKDYKPAPW